MNDVRKDELLRAIARRELTPVEESQLEAWLAEHPHERAAWEEERALSRALRSLPDVPVSSNFTARVLNAVDLEETRDRRRRAGRPWLRFLLPRVGWSVAAAVLVVLGVQQYRASHEQRQIAQALAAVSPEFAEAPSPELLRDFDAINQLRQVAVTSDDELLQVFQ